MTSRFLTTKDVAQRYLTSEDVVRRWIRQGRLKAINIAVAPARTYRISTEALAAFERKNETVR